MRSEKNGLKRKKLPVDTGSGMVAIIAVHLKVKSL
jgi:hypothetical protein